MPSRNRLHLERPRRGRRWKIRHWHSRANLPNELRARTSRQSQSEAKSKFAWDARRTVKNRLRNAGIAADSRLKRRDARLRAAQDQGVDVVRALVGVDGLEVHDVADHVVFVGDAVAAGHVARHPPDSER